MTLDKLKELRDCFSPDATVHGVSLRDALAYATTEIERQTIIAEQEHRIAMRLARELETVNARVTRLEQALQFYADMRTYVRTDEDGDGTRYAECDHDAGRRAKDALATAPQQQDATQAQEKL